jgi:hypothetical protein
MFPLPRTAIAADAQLGLVANKPLTERILPHHPRYIAGFAAPNGRRYSGCPCFGMQKLEIITISASQITFPMITARYHGEDWEKAGEG